MASIFTVVSSVEHVIICCTFAFPIFSWHIVYILILSQVNNWNSIFPISTNSTRKMIVAQLSAFWKFTVFIANGAKPSSTYHLAFLKRVRFYCLPKSPYLTSSVLLNTGKGLFLFSRPITLIINENPSFAKRIYSIWRNSNNDLVNIYSPKKETHNNFFFKMIWISCVNEAGKSCHLCYRCTCFIIYLRNKSCKPECDESFNMDWRILVFSLV